MLDDDEDLNQFDFLPNIFLLINSSTKLNKQLMSSSFYPSSGSTFRKEEQQKQQIQKQQQQRQQLFNRFNNKQRREQPQQQQTTYNPRYIPTVRTDPIAMRTTTIPPHRHSTTLLQQQQITDLEKKIDLILMHNEKLQSEKQRYRHLYQQLKQSYEQLQSQLNRLQQQQKVHQHQLSLTSSLTTARFVNQQSTLMVQKLRRQLQLSTASYEKKLQSSQNNRNQLKQQLSTLSKIIQDLNNQNKQLKLQMKQQSLKVDSLTFQLKEQFIRSQVELENKLRDQFLIREIQYKNQRKMVVETCEAEVKQLQRVFNQEKKKIEYQHAQDINILRSQLEEQKTNQIQQLITENNKRLEFIENNHREEIKREQDKAIDYINNNIENIKQQDNMIRLEYEEEINRLKESLENRKKLIEKLIGSGENLGKQELQEGVGDNNGNVGSNPITSTPSTQFTWLPELLTMKQHLHNITTQYLQQSQLLKLKLTQKFRTDITSLKSIYQNKIQLISLHNSQLQQQNNRLRSCYEQSLEQNIKIKKQHQLQKSQLKNVIRKLNIQVHGIQEQYKLNIEGVRSMNNTFSMTMMKSMIQVRQKANFYTEQNRKLRQSYDDHEKQLAQTQRLCAQKVSYFEQKVIVEKQKSTKLINDLKQQLQLTQLQAQQRQSHLRDSLDKQHEMIHQVVSEMRKQVETLSNQNQQLKGKVSQMNGKVKDKDYQIDKLRSVISELEGDVERLKLELSMGGDIGQKNFTDTLNQWKYHYQTTIQQLQQQIQILQSKLDTKQSQLQQIVKKYKLLQHNMNKIVKSLNKKSQLQNKVLEIGLDNNLVNNMGQLFGSQDQEEESGDGFMIGEEN